MVILGNCSREAAAFRKMPWFPSTFSPARIRRLTVLGSAGNARQRRRARVPESLQTSKGVCGNLQTPGSRRINKRVIVQKDSFQ